MAKMLDFEVAMADELFDKVLVLNVILENLPDGTFNEDGRETKWMKLLSENDSLPLMYKLVSIVYSIPVGNAFVKRVVSLALLQWSKERNRLNITVTNSSKFRFQFLQDARTHFQRSKTAEANC